MFLYEVKGGRFMKKIGNMIMSLLLTILILGLIGVGVIATCFILLFA
jgi:hypothetical protein